MEFKREKERKKKTLILFGVEKAIIGYINGSIAVITPQLLLQIPCDNRVFGKYITLAPMAKVKMSGRFVTWEKV